MMNQEVKTTSKVDSISGFAHVIVTNRPPFAPGPKYFNPFSVFHSRTRGFRTPGVDLFATPGPVRCTVGPESQGHTFLFLT